MNDLLTKRKFSIIIPTYNRAAMLDRCLESLVNQTYKDFEVFVCDDGSTDNSKEITEKYKDKLNVQYLWEPNWGGPARPRNRGIDIAQGEWICFLDSDDTWYPNKLMVCKDYLNNYDLIYHDLMMNNGIEKKKQGFVRDLKSNSFRDLMLNGNAIPNSSVCVRKDILISAGGFSEEKKLIAVEDYDLWIKLSLMKTRFKRLPLALGEYWSGGGNITIPGLTHIKRVKSVYDKYWDKLSIRDRMILNAKLLYVEGVNYENEGKRDIAIKKYKEVIRIGNCKFRLRALYRLIIKKNYF